MPLLHLAPFFLSAEPCAKPPQSLPHAMFSSIPIQKVQILLTKIFTLAHCVHFSKRQKRANSLRIKFVAPENYQMARQTAGARKAFFSLATFPFLLHRPISNYELVLDFRLSLTFESLCIAPETLVQWCDLS